MSVFRNKQMIYRTNPLVEYARTYPYPTAILNGKPILPLSDNIIHFLVNMKDGMDIRQAEKLYKKISGKSNTTGFVQFMINRKLLIEDTKYVWNGNTFGASLFGENEKKAIERVLLQKNLCRNSNLKLTELEYIEPSYCTQLEHKLMSMLKCKYVLLVNSGTSALELALRAIGVKSQNDEVIVPCYTYIGTAAAILKVGGKPILCNINNRYVLDANEVENLINEKTRAIICVHLRGMAGNAKRLMEIAQAHNIYLIEDCAQAFGCNDGEKMLGTIGHIGCYSFHEHKLISSGEGGALATNDEMLYKQLCISSDGSQLFKYPELLPGIPGSNMRMTEIQASIVLMQLKHIVTLKSHLQQLYKIFQNCFSLLEGFSVMQSFEGDIPQSVYICCDSVNSAEKLSDWMESLGIPTTILYRANVINHNIYLYWPYILKASGYIVQWEEGSHELHSLFPASLSLLSRTLSIPLGLNITTEMVNKLCDEIYDFIAN